MAIDNWEPAPLWLLLVLLVVVRIFFVLSPPSFHGLGQDVKREVAQLLEPHWDSTCSRPVRVR
jgi:hypothetical protein